MNFRQFALKNVKRNPRAYFAYFLSSSFAVMIFFTYAMFIFHPDIANSVLGNSAQLVMRLAEYVIFFFSFLFILYSISSFLKGRRKEFGLLTILGCESRQLKFMIFLENMIIGLISIITGIGLGIVFSKAFLMLGASVVEIKELAMYLPWKAMSLTVTAFFVLFLIGSLLPQLFVRFNRVLYLLQGTEKPKQEPKVSIWLSLLSLSSIVGAFYLMTNKELSKEEINSVALYAIALGIVGTYFFFTQLSVWIICLLKKKRSISWRGTNLLWISEMAYKMRDNALTSFMVTMVIAMSCSAIGAILSINQYGERIFRENPFAFTYSVFSENGWQAELTKVDQELRSHSVDFEKIELVSIRPKFRETNSNVDMIKQSDYKRLEELLHLKKAPALKSGEALIITNKQEDPKKKIKNTKQLSLSNVKETLHVVDRFEEVIKQGSNNFIVVSDATYHQFKSLIKEKEGDTFYKDDIEKIRIFYFIQGWVNAKIPDSDSLELKIGKKLDEWKKNQLNSGEEWVGTISSRAVDYMQYRQFTNTAIFTGVFVAAIFSLFSASLLYFKLYIELNRDQHIIHGLSKIGLSQKEVKRSVTIQIAVLFFIPMLAAALETVIGLKALKSQIPLVDPFLAMTGLAAFFAAQFIYFLIVRARYLSQLKRVMV